MPRLTLASLLVLGAVACLCTPAFADALDSEYAAMRDVPGATRDFVQCRLDRGAVREVPTGSPCAAPCAAPCPRPYDPCCPQRGCWSWRIALMGWLPGLCGTTVLGGQEADVSFAWTDWFDHLDQIESALQLGVSAQYDRWLFEVAGLRMVLGDSVPLETPGPLAIAGSLDAELTMVVLKGLVGYEFARTRLSSCDCWPHIRWTAYAGARYYSLGVEANLYGPNRQLTILDETQDWVDPLIGARGRLELSKRWAIVAEADIGGFGVGSDLAWHALLAAEWKAARWFALQGGWNVLDVDYSTGSGADAFVFDLTMSGPFVNFVFMF